MRTFQNQFPLTLSLSLKEREQHIVRLESYERVGFADRLAAILPLPKGEGRGEGEQDSLQPHTVSIPKAFPTVLCPLCPG